MEGTQAPLWRSRSGLVLLGFLAVAGFYLVTEHWAHTLGALPYLLLVGCPLMHLFMHHGHGHRHGSPVPRPDEPGPPAPGGRK